MLETITAERRSLDEIRTGIDEIDAQIVALWAERNRLAALAAQHKRETGGTVYVHGRDIEVRRQFGDNCEEHGINRDLGRTVIGALMTTSYETQRRVMQDRPDGQ